MLKRLELVGFKSFADKTQFDFPAGLTAVVGPNGSGKSNVVDAVRWVLGEQSAKSLRGGEMTDVIFNGSASRRGLGMAEVTLTFDNSRRVLASEAVEVQITRRVYRSGEGEYLINQTPCRLKDIKDLFLGSGAGTDAYCIIEQGRVDVLLQASTKERRIIFEEAAGTSRFRARKLETLRKLERVDQNLARLRDILEEVEKQLRGVRLQAAKAQRYQEYAGRLRELRETLSLQEFHQLTGLLKAAVGQLEALRLGLADEIAQAEVWERELAELEAAIGRHEGAVRMAEADLAQARQQIAAEETTQTHEGALADDLESELAQARQRLAELSQHLRVLNQDAQAAAVERERAEEQFAGQGQTVRAAQERLEATEARLAQLQEQATANQEERLERMRTAARLQNDVASYQAQLDQLAREQLRLRLRSEQAAGHLASLDAELQELTSAEETAQQQLAETRTALADTRTERDRLRGLADETAQHAARMRERRSGLVSRLEMLEGLERSHEGLGTGVREVFAHLEAADPGPWRSVRGLVADFLTVRREYAPLIDLALGERAQRFLVTDASALALALRERGTPFSGRVSFLPVGTLPEQRPQEGDTALTRGGEALGVVAPAERVVRCEDPTLARLPQLLLSRTFIVRDLAAAAALAAQQPGVRCVTLHGELLEADGTLTIGTHHAEAGIVSRKSELRDLREQVVVADLHLGELERDLLDLRSRVASLDSAIEARMRELDEVNAGLTELRARLGLHRQRRDDLHLEVEGKRSEITGLEQDIGVLTTSWQRARDYAAEAEARVQALQERLVEDERESRRREIERQQLQVEAVSAQVARGQTEERLTALRARQESVEADLRRRQAERAQTAAAVAATEARLVEGQRKLLAASSALAVWYARKEVAERRLARWRRPRRNDQRRVRQETAERVQTSRASWRGRQEQLHSRELEEADLRHRRDGLCARLHEDYQVDLLQHYQQAVAGESPPAFLVTPLEAGPAQEEIAELRRKLARLGSVNLESLQELTELEARAGTLRVQFDDLTAAQQTLQNIIARTNADSQRLFAETFATVREHFRELFRKLFGGGMADVVLEDESDVLECGIEIVARPPGKELRSISLMSGGEKTMTAVALLLAIFRSKPSPFCILDEVDAALDEANIGRFTGVLREFLERSQFILITHSKRTMACADVLYGVTMQESGVSKRMAVQLRGLARR